MRILLSVLFFSLMFVAKSQEPGDIDYVFTSIVEAKGDPDIVYHLSLQKQKLEKFPEEIWGFKNLKSLNLSRNKISLIPIEIKYLEQLELLDLSKNKISRIPPVIQALSRLESLLLSKNNIDAIPKEISGLEHLRVIDLWSNNIKKIDPSIENLQELEQLDLRGILLSDEMKKKLSIWLPETKVLTSGGCNCGF